MHNPIDMRERFLSDHARINALAADLIALIDLPAPPDVFKLSGARWAFASNLMQHLAIKERHVYAKLEADLRPEAQALFAKSKADIVQRFADYTNHMEAWPTSKATGDWSTYRPKAIAVVKLFTARLKYEETELIDAIVRLGIDMNTPAAVTSNWVRKAFAVKSKVEDL